MSMKYKSKNDIGERVHCIFTKDVVEIIQVMSQNTWIYEVPNLLIEFLDDNYDASLESIKYIPNIYFQLNYKFQKDSTLIKETIKSFRKHNRVNEINIRLKPLKKRNLKSNE